jgi:ABC-2 type transport system permease protein
MIANSFRWEVNAVIGFVERQKNLYRRYWVWEAVWLLYSLVSVVSIGYLASGLAALGDTHFNLKQTQLYLLIGSLMWSYLSMVFFEIAFSISGERWEGTIEYTFMAPIKRATYLLGICIASLLYGILRAGVVGLVVAFTFKLDLSRADFGSALAILGASTLPLIGIGILTSLLPLLSPEKGDQMTVAVQGVLLLISGVYYPLSVLPLPLRVAGQLSPLTYTLDGIRHALLHGQHLAESLPTIGLLLLMGVIMVPAALWIFGRAEARAKRLGLLKRSG